MDEKIKEMTLIQKVASDCVERWGIDKKTKNFSGKLGRFVSQLKDDRELGEILIELVKHYNYYSRVEIEKFLQNVYKVIREDLQLEKNETIFSRIEDDSKIDSSNNLLEEFKILNDVSNTFSHDIEKLHLENFDYITNVIFIDDIIGTGKTVERFFKKNIKKLSKVSIYIFCVEILEDGKKYLDEFFKKENLNCLIIPNNIHCRAFKNSKIFNEHLSEKEQKFKMLEETILGSAHNCVMGYENSQAIVSFYRNTPNNTLGSFWYNGQKWNGLFPRSNDRPLFMSKGGRKARKTMNYNINKPRSSKDG